MQQLGKSLRKLRKRILYCRMLRSVKTTIVNACPRLQALECSLAFPALRFGPLATHRVLSGLRPWNRQSHAHCSHLPRPTCMDPCFLLGIHAAALRCRTPEPAKPVRRQQESWPCGPDVLPGDFSFRRSNFSMHEAFSVFNSFFGGRDPFEDFSMMYSNPHSLTSTSGTGWDVKIVTVKRADGSTYTERYDSRGGSKATSQAGSEAGDAFTSFNTDPSGGSSSTQSWQTNANMRPGSWDFNWSGPPTSPQRLVQQVPSPRRVHPTHLPAKLSVAGSQVRPTPNSPGVRTLAPSKEFVSWRSN